MSTNEALAAFLRTQKNFLYLITGQVANIEEHKHAKRGRPKTDEIPEVISSYQVQIEIGELVQESYEEILKRESIFVLVTTLPEKDYPDEFVLLEYKEQNSIENRFSFVKQTANLVPCT